jgi:hypothetical protein
VRRFYCSGVEVSVLNEIISWLKSIPADWFSAVGTVGALFVALILLGFQTRDRVRDARERHRAHAELISGALGPIERADPKVPQGGRTAIDLFNSSLSPVYRLVVGIVDIQGTAPRTLEAWLDLGRNRGGVGQVSLPMTTVSILPPGTFRVWIPGTDHTASMGARPGAELAFTDRAGKHWIRRANGELKELKSAPLDYFKHKDLYGPYELRTPERVG